MLKTQKTTVQTKKDKEANKSEVTVTIMHQDKVNYHETFLMDLTKHNTFEYNGKKYNVPAKDTAHYHPSFWRFDVKLATFFELHKTLATFFDWFHMRDRAIYEVGYLYWKDNEDPEDLKDYVGKVDFAQECFNLDRNTSIERGYGEIGEKLRGPQSNVNWMKAVLAIIIGIVIVIAVFVVLTGQMAPGGNQVIQNITATNATLPPQLTPIPTIPGAP